MQSSPPEKRTPTFAESGEGLCRLGMFWTRRLRDARRSCSRVWTDGDVVWRGVTGSSRGSTLFIGGIDDFCHTVSCLPIARAQDG